MNDDNGTDAFARLETYRFRRIEAKLYALFLALTFPLFTFILSLAVGNGAINVRMEMAAVYAGMVAVLTLAIFSRLISSKLRFCVVFFPDRVQFGRWLAKRDFAYQDVEMIYLFPGPIIKVRCGKKTAEVFLDNESKLTCFTLLRSLCSNAILVDSKLEAHLPTNPRSVEKPLHILEHFYRTKAWGGVFRHVISWPSFFCCGVGRLVDWKQRLEDHFGGHTVPYYDWFRRSQHRWTRVEIVVIPQKVRDKTKTVVAAREPD